MDMFLLVVLVSFYEIIGSRRTVPLLQKGEVFYMVLLAIGLFIFGLFILYVVIETAVRRGINSSAIGQFLEEKYEMEIEKKSILGEDLDDD